MITGKQQELRRRDELFLSVAQDLLLEDGYHGLTMARVAELTRFSKGTVYNRFSCKEEIVVELGSRCREQRLAMLNRAANYRGGTRERMVALGEAAEFFERLHPDKMRVLGIINAEAILEKVSENMRNRMKAYDISGFNLSVSIVQDAVTSGDLVLPPRSTTQDISFALWCMFDSGAAMVIGGFPHTETGIRDPYKAIGRGCHLLMDGCGWKPLTSVVDYRQVAQHVRDELFAEEQEQLARMVPQDVPDTSV